MPNAPTRHDKFRDLPQSSRARLSRIQTAYMQKQAATETYAKEVDAAVTDDGLSYRMIADVLGIDHVAVFRSRERWIKGQKGERA